MRKGDGGIGRLKKRLAAIPVAVRKAAAVATVEAANDIANRMKTLVPVDDGDLRDSITVTPGGQSTPSYSQPGGSYAVPENMVAITAGNSAVRYAHLVEHGSEQADAQPYFFPAYRLGKKKANAKIKRAMRKAIKEAK